MLGFFILGRSYSFLFFSCQDAYKDKKQQLQMDNCFVFTIFSIFIVVLTITCTMISVQNNACIDLYSLVNYVIPHSPSALCVHAEKCRVSNSKVWLIAQPVLKF